MDINNLVNFEKILEYYDIDCSKGNIKCINPAHRDNNPSMGVDRSNPEHPRLHCFSCGCFYDVLDIVAVEENYEFNSAECIKKAEKILGAQQTAIRLTPQKGREEQLVAELKKDNKALIERCHKLLVTSYDATNSGPYVFKRGLSMNTVKRMKIGVLQEKDRYLLRSHPFYKYIIPYNADSCTNFLLTGDPQDNKEDLAKYYKPSGQKDTLFNGGILEYSYKNYICTPVFVTEGCFDALSVEEITNEAHGIALLGLNLRLLQDKLLTLNKEDFVFIIGLDNDKPGREASDKLKIWLRENDFYFIDGISDYKDYNEYLIQDREGFRDFIKNKIQQSIDYYIHNENYIINKDLKIENKLKQYPTIEVCFLLMIFVYGQELLEITYENNLKPSFLQNEDCRNIFRLFIKEYSENGYLVKELFLHIAEAKYKKDYSEFWEHCENNCERITQNETNKENIFVKIIEIIKKRAEQSIYNNMSKEVIQRLEKGETNKIRDTVAQAQDKITQLNTQKSSFSLTDFMREWLTRKEEITGLNFGFPRLEKAIDGLRPGSLVVIAGRPAMGKTTFGMCLAVNCGYYKNFENTVEKGGNVVFFSLEMTHQEIYTKLFKRFLREGFKKYANTAENKLEEVDKVIKQYEGYIEKTNVVFEVPNTRYYEDIEDKIKSYAIFKQKTVFIIDHLHLLTVKDSINRVLDLNTITSRLKQIAIQYDITIVLLAQLNRAVESKESKRPTMSALRDSGSIEENADIVCFLYREGYYCRDVPEFQNLSAEQKEQVLSQAEVIISKNRSGETTTIPLKFEGEYSNFSELTAEQEKDRIIIPVEEKKTGWAASKKNVKN